MKRGPQPLLSSSPWAWSLAERLRRCGRRNPNSNARRGRPQTWFKRRWSQERRVVRTLADWLSMNRTATRNLGILPLLAQEPAWMPAIEELERLGEPGEHWGVWLDPKTRQRIYLSCENIASVAPKWLKAAHTVVAIVRRLLRLEKWRRSTAHLWQRLRQGPPTVKPQEATAEQWREYLERKKRVRELVLSFPGPRPP